MFFRCLDLGTTVAFVGAGCSTPLGYDRWGPLIGSLIDKTLEGLGNDANDRTRLDGFRTRLEGNEQIDDDVLLHMAGVCRRNLEDSAFESFLDDKFRSPSIDVGHNQSSPLSALLDLPIYRFITTNYDEEIERALEQERDVKWNEFGIGTDESNSNHLAQNERGDEVEFVKSFTQEDQFLNELAVFSLSRVDSNRNTVFHCHGRYDRPPSVVMGEEDYQRWYLSHKSPAPAFRQTLNLLLGSNPILFVGYGLTEQDVLHPLRMFNAIEPERRTRSSLFALMPADPNGANNDFHDALFERYGVEVIPYVWSPRSGPEWGKALMGAIEKLKTDYRIWVESWRRKPKIRPVRVSVSPPQAYYHYGIQPDDDFDLGSKRVDKQLDELKKSIEYKKKRVIVLHGRGGTGKSWHALKLMKRLETRARSGGVFFWSSYYADDALSGLDRLLAYFDVTPEHPDDRLACLRRVLKEKKCLIILDGIERILWSTPKQRIGRPASAHVRRLFEILAHESSKCSVILTTRLIPDLYVQDKDPRGKNRREAEEDGASGSPHGIKGVELIELEPMRTADLRETQVFQNLNDVELLSALCSLVDGHVYALALVAGMIQGRRTEEARELVKKLTFVLGGVPPDGRVSRMIQEATDNIDAQTKGLARLFLRRLAVLMSPLSLPTVNDCYHDARKEWNDTASAKGVECFPEGDLVEGLVRGRLVFRVGRGDRDVDEITIHPTVRSYIFEPAIGRPRDQLPNFTLAGFTSGTAVIHPRRPESRRVLESLFDRFIQSADRAVEQGEAEQARDLCRSAFSVIRSRMESNTASRWCKYDKYARFGIRLIDLARRIAGKNSWIHAERHDHDLVEDEDAPLYADELAWLYNDTGLIFCAEGHMLDAYRMWEQGYQLNRAIERGKRPEQYEVQSLLHLSHTFIELGRLDAATTYLDDTEAANEQFGDDDYAARIVGYRGLIKHLEGNLLEAKDHYEDAINRLQGDARNPRAEAIFRRHRADLLIEKKDFVEAEEQIRQCRALADGAKYDDLIAYSRISYGHLFRAQGRFPEAMREYTATLERARKIGIRRLQADALAELSRLALDLGDGETARRRALQAMMIANLLGLGLRQTHGLVVLGLATIAAGQRHLGDKYLHHARSQAERQGYWLRGHEVERLEEDLRWAPSNNGDLPK